MMFFFLARGIKSPKPKPLIRIPDSVMTPYNAQVLIIQIKCQKNVCIANFIFCKYIGNIPFLYIMSGNYILSFCVLVSVSTNNSEWSCE